MSTICNPVLRGFNPDPCFCRDENKWYIAVSTFEWYPGVLIYESEDFVNWTLKKAPLERLSQLNLIGEQPSGGIWAPALTYDDGLYYLVYTDTKTWKGERGFQPFRDMHNYLVTSSTIEGPWSEPIYMLSGGYDPSFFCDDDGKKYFVYIRRDFRQLDNNIFEGIILKEYCEKTKKLIGDDYIIYNGANLETDYYVNTNFYEGPHIFKKDGWYYLITAEGGPGYTHATCVSRSKSIKGPYEMHPNTPMLSSRNTDNEMQKTGHGNFVLGPAKQWFMSYLCSRPLKGHRISPLGRETGVVPIEWINDWPYVKDGGIIPPLEFEVASDTSQKTDLSFSLNFREMDKLPVEVQSLRVPITDNWCKLIPEGLEIVGRESPYSRFEQSLLGVRIRHFEHEFSTAVDINPSSYQIMAGLMLRYDEETWYYLTVTRLNNGNRGLCYMTMDRGTLSYTYDLAPIPNIGFIHLKSITKMGVITFSYSIDGKNYTPIKELNADFNKLCDEYAQPVGFTGSFGCITANDMLGDKTKALFQYFDYKEIW